MFRSSKVNRHISRPKRVLIRLPNWIGDAVMATPAISAFRRYFPDASITLAARAWVAPLFLSYKGVEEVITIDSTKDRGIRSIMKTASAFKNRHFDTALILPNSFESALLPFLARIPRRIGHATDKRAGMLTQAVPVPVFKKMRHEVFYYMNLVASMLNPEDAKKLFPISDMPGSPPLKLYVDVKMSSKIDSVLHDLGIMRGDILIGFNPGAAYGPAKCWPWERFKDLANKLCNIFPCKILVLGTQKEEEIASRICDGLEDRVHNLAGRTGLVDVAALISRLDLMVTNDSGLMHVAAALGVPIVAIFGSTNPVTTGPWSISATVVRRPLDCSPCMRRECNRGDFACMNRISVDDVLSECIESIENNVVNIVAER